MATTSSTNNSTMNTSQISQLNQPSPLPHHQSIPHPSKSLTPNTMNSSTGQSPQIPNHYDPNLNHNQMMNMANHPMASSQYNLNYHQQRKFLNLNYIFRNSFLIYFIFLI